MAGTMCMAAVFTMASVVVQAVQCSNGGECQSSGSTQGIVSLLQKNVQMNVEKHRSLLGTRDEQTRKIPDQLILTGQWTSVDEIPGAVGKNVQNTIALNSDLTIRWLSDDACQDYLTEHFDQELVDILRNEHRGSYRGDICRAAVLSREGGYYTDLDAQWLVPMRDLVDESTTFMSAFGEGKDILNAVMASESDSEIMGAVLQQQRQWYSSPAAQHTGWMGPATLHNALRDVQKKRCAELDMNAHTPTKVCGQHHLRLYEQREICNAGPASECPPTRASSQFDGLHFGLFQTGPEGKLVGWPRFAECSAWGCGGGGWDVSKIP